MKRLMLLVDLLDHESMGSLAYIIEARKPLLSEMRGLEANYTNFEINELGVLLAHVELCSLLLECIKVT